MLKNRCRRAVVEATADTEPARNFARAHQATVDHSTASERRRHRSRRRRRTRPQRRRTAALDATRAPAKRSAPAARSKLDDATARLQATTALLERCRREWLKGAQPVLTEVGQNLDEQTERAARPSRSRYPSSRSAHSHRRRPRHATGWITGVECTGNVTEYQPEPPRRHDPSLRSGEHPPERSHPAHRRRRRHSLVSPDGGRSLSPKQPNDAGSRTKARHRTRNRTGDGR